jgi:hypothetical protein
MDEPKKKNQHYVPRFLLRKFSRDGKSVALVVLTKGVAVLQAPLANQCSRDYFYGRDPAVENAFAEWEGETAARVRRLDVDALQGLSFRDLYQLRQFAHYQHLRTEGAARSVNSMVGGFAKAVLSESPDGPPPGLDDVTIGLKEPQHLALYNATTSTPLLLDLEVKFLVRSEPPGFVISDDPVVLSNQWAEHHPKFRTYRGLTGLGVKGIQMFLPLSPQVCMAVFDPATYRCGNSASRVRHIGRDDVNRLNRLQVLHAMKCIYYDPSWSPDLDPIATRDLKVSGPSREWTIETGPKTNHPDGTIRQLVVSIAPDVRIGANFDFAETIDMKPYDNYELAILPIRSADMLKFAEYYANRIDSMRAPERAPAKKPRR